MIISIPARHVFQAVKECAQKGVKFLIIISAGFSEIGNQKEEKEIVAYAHQYGMRILGPNVFGIYSARTSLNATFGPKDLRAGKTAIITQSGALGIALMGKTQTEGIGLSAIVSVGNKADITESELLEYFSTDKKTKVIFMYIEGLKNGRRFIQSLKKITRKKMVIILKSGRSKKGVIAAASHTGSLACKDKVFCDVMRQHGTIRALTIQEAISRIKFLAKACPPKGEKTVILTNGGGIGVLAADACEKHKVRLFDNPPVLEKIVQGTMPKFGSFKNPIDITGQARVADYRHVLQRLIKNKEIGAIVCLGCQTAVLEMKKLSFFIEQTFKQSRKVKPIVYSFLGGQEVKEVTSSLSKKGLPIFADVEKAVSCLGAAYFHSRYKKRIPGRPAKAKLNLKKINRVLNQAQQDKRNFLLAPEAQEVMKTVKIPIPKSLALTSPKEISSQRNKIVYPAVMKVISPDIIHKSEIGGVILNIDNRSEAEKSYRKIIKNCRHYNPQAKIEGVEITEMVEEDLELIIGAQRDKTFGPIITFGLGGIYVEILNDVCFRALPISRRQARSMIDSINSSSLLLGVRGEKRKDIGSVVDTIIKVGTILLKFPRITDIEINPLVVYEQGVKALDVRILM